MKTVIPYFLLLFCIFSVHFSLAQNKLSTRSKKAARIYTEAQAAYRDYKFDACIDLLNVALEKDPQFIEAYFLKAEIYNHQKQFEKEALCFEKSIEINPQYFIYQYYNYAEALYNAGQYSKAKESFAHFIALKKGKPHILKQAEIFIDKCDFAIHLLSNPVEFNPQNLGEQINNSKDQYWPSLSIDGKTMVYTELQIDSTRKTAFGTYAHQEDFYTSYLKADGWTQGVPIGAPINTPGNEGAQQLSADGKTLVFTGCNRRDGLGLCDIYFSYKTKEGWSKPVNAGPIINSNYSEKQPSLSADGRSLYFSSNRPESIGGMDLYVSKKNAYGSWTRPKNLGRKINTYGDELSPYIHRDNETLYFSSTGHPGLGQNDLFISTRKDSNEWSNPKNMGYPINSHMDEIGLVVDNFGKKAYYSSNISNKSRDIFEFELPESVRPKPVSYVSGKVYNVETYQALQANLELLKPETGDTIMWIKADTLSGEYLLCLPSGNNYALNANYPGFLFWSDQFTLSESDNVLKPFELDIPLSPIKPGETIVLRNIFFETNAHDILPQSKAELQKITDFLNHNPNLKVEISGHTDNQGSPEYNQKLSQLRAEAVYNYQLDRIKNPARLSFKGYGESQPIAPNDTETNRRKNRRTELKILE